MANTDSQRIAKNTIFLYLRMFLMMAVSLYTSRVILKTLGVEDFGIYNVVAGIVVLFSFINNAMAIASQRFLSFALGRGDEKEVSRVFSMSLTSHFAIALFVFLIAETIGLWLLGKMNFPENRMNAVPWVFQLAILTTCINIIRVPYNASIIAHERMSFYAWISIVEAMLKLGVVFLLLAYNGDKLIFYSFLLMLVACSINVAYKIFCNRKFPSTRYHFFWDSKMFKRFVGFSGWSLAGSLANVGAQQGLNMIINVFCGVAVNAAVGISNQVMGAVSQFLGNFQTAFNPQLVKSYANGNREYFMKLIFKTSKLSYYLLFIIALPILLYCDFLLDLWLDVVPEYAVCFSQLMIVFLLFDAISGPLWISVQATGNIRNYQLIMGGLILLNLPVTFTLLYLGYSPVYAFVGRVVINIITLFVRIGYLKKLIELPVADFFKRVIFVLLIVSLCIVPLPLWLRYIWTVNWTSVLGVSLISVIVSFVTIYIIGLTKDEQTFIREIISKRL